MGRVSSVLTFVLAGLLSLSEADAGVRSMGYGPTGPSGPQGIQGNPGQNGKDGAAGSQGIQGPKGDPGSQGQQGVAGQNGKDGAAGPQGLPGAKGDAGAAGTNGTNGTNGTPGIVPIYGPSGLRSGSKAWMGTVSSANGLWTASIAPAGCSVAPWNIQVQALGLDQTAAGVRVANVSAVSTTTVSGTVTQPATVSLLGVLSLNLATASPTTVYVEAFCN